MTGQVADRDLSPHRLSVKTTVEEELERERAESTLSRWVTQRGLHRVLVLELYFFAACILYAYIQLFLFYTMYHHVQYLTLPPFFNC